MKEMTISLIIFTIVYGLVWYSFILVDLYAMYLGYKEKKKERNKEK